MRTIFRSIIELKEKGNGNAKIEFRKSWRLGKYIISESKTPLAIYSVIKMRNNFNVLLIIKRYEEYFASLNFGFVSILKWRFPFFIYLLL